MAVDPDLVLIQMYRNDAFPSWAGLRRLGSEQVFPSYRLVPVRLRRGAVRGSQLLAFVEKQLNSVMVDADFESLYQEGSEGWDQLQAALTDLSQNAARK